MRRYKSEAHQGVLQGPEGVPPGRGGGGGRRAVRVGPGAGPAFEPEPGPGDRPASRAVGFVLGRVIADPGRPAPGLRGGVGNPGPDRPRPRRPAFEDRPARPGVRLSREIPFASVPPSRNGSGPRLQFDRGSNLRRVPRPTRRLDAGVAGTFDDPKLGLTPSAVSLNLQNQIWKTKSRWPRGGPRWGGRRRRT